jgi:hypothetical protein
VVLASETYRGKVDWFTRRLVENGGSS